MIAAKIHRLEHDASRPSIGSLALRGLGLLAIISILVCLPAFHSATNLHHSGDVVDAFDLGVNVPESNKGGVLGVILVGAFLFTAVQSGGAARVRGLLVTRRAGGHCLLSRRTTRSPHASGRPRRSSDSCDDDSSPTPSSSMNGMMPTPLDPVSLLRTKGFFFVRESTPNPRHNRHRRQGVVHAIQT